MDKLGKPSRPKLDKILSRWSLPPISPELRAIIDKHNGVKEPTLKDIRSCIREEITQIRDIEEKAKIELAALDWLYRFIRGNIKRGRVFELSQVLSERCADCLGYAKIFDILGKRFGLDIGIVEVVIDNAGRYVPHSVNIVKLANQRYQLVDPWYGSKDIHHQRIGVMLKEKGKWLIKDMNWDEVERGEEVKGLPPNYVDALTCYIMGNRHLERGITGNEKELDRAIGYYNAAIELYPTNPRFYFNRAIAYENKGEGEKATGDYTQALRDEASQIRVLAREYEESTQLIELDQMDISPEQQEIYLLRKGFITGKEKSPQEVASQYGISTEEVERIISQIEASISHPR